MGDFDTRTTASHFTEEKTPKSKLSRKLSEKDSVDSGHDNEFVLNSGREESSSCESECDSKFLEGVDEEKPLTTSGDHD